MKSFTDNAGRIWTVAVNVAAIKRVRAICDVDLNAIVEAEQNPHWGYKRILYVRLRQLTIQRVNQ